MRTRPARRVYITGMAAEVQHTLTSLGADACIADDAHFATRLDALRVIADRGPGRSGDTQDNTTGQHTGAPATFHPGRCGQLIEDTNQRCFTRRLRAEVDTHKRRST
jgi:hypothetical protein